MLHWREFFLLLFVYRCLYSVAGQVLITQFTQLGDAHRYQSGAASLHVSFLWNSTLFTEMVGLVLWALTFGNKVAINIGFQAIAFVGIYKFMMALEPELRKKVALLLFFPSFSIWTSSAGKEAIVVFALGVLCAYLVDIYYGRDRFRLLQIASVYLLFIFKAHYLIPIMFVFFVTKVCARTSRKALVALVVGLVSLFPLYAFRDRISELSFAVLPHFLVEKQGRSTREAFWVDQWDVFWKAPEGMFQSFYGPTLAELFSQDAQILKIWSFYESLLLVAILGIIFVRQLPTMPAYNFFVATFGLFWILFPNYPFGVMNPGSAIRYRSGYYLFVAMIVVLFASREVFVRWRGNRPASDR